jgi:hypothetical protein
MPRATKRGRKNRGVPPPATFDIDTLPGSANLTVLEPAAIIRRTPGALEQWRRDPNHPLKWRYVDGRPLYRVDAVHLTYVGSSELDAVFLQRVRQKPKRLLLHSALACIWVRRLVFVALLFLLGRDMHRSKQRPNENNSTQKTSDWKWLLHYISSWSERQIEQFRLLLSRLPLRDAPWN